MTSRRNFLLGLLATVPIPFFSLGLDEPWQHVLEPRFRFAYKLTDGSYIQAPGIKEIVSTFDEHRITAETLISKTEFETSGGMLLDARGNVLTEFDFTWPRNLIPDDQLIVHYTLSGVNGLGIDEAFEYFRTHRKNGKWI